jgi:hypothetical protein
MRQPSKKECLEGRSFTGSGLTPTPETASPPKNPQRRAESHAYQAELYTLIINKKVMKTIQLHVIEIVGFHFSRYLFQAKE